MGYTLTQIVNELMIEMGEGQTNKFARFYQLGVAALREFNLDTTGVPKPIVLDINDDDTADLPLDYLQYIRIGICVNGEIICLGRNDALCINKLYDNCNDSVAHLTVTQFGYPNGYLSGYLYGRPNYRNGEFQGGLFGIGADNNCLGYYRINKETNQIVFSQLTCRREAIIMEYMSDIDSINEDFEVHPFCIAALKDYIFWKVKQRSSKPLGEQQMANRDYINSSRLMRMRFASATKEEWISAFRSGIKASPKL